MTTQKNKPESEQEQPPIKVEDLPLETGNEDAVKGGPAYIRFDGVEGEFRPRRP